MAIGRLNQAAIQHLNPDQLIPSLSKREAVMSSRIEGTRTTLQEVFVSQDGDEDNPDKHEVLNYELTLRSGVEALKSGRKLGFSLLKELHHQLLQGVRGENKNPGAYRRDQVFLGSGANIQSAKFVPPRPTAVDGCMEDLQIWMGETQGNLPVLVKIALTHYQFEVIHPFSDGNGRIGRLLIALQFLAEDIVQTPLLYVSPYLEARRDDYYRKLFNVSSKGDFNAWIEFFLRSVHDTAVETMNKITAIEALLHSFTQLVAEATQSHNPLRLVECLRISPFITIPDAATLLHTATHNARNAVKVLTDLGILQNLKIPKKTRKRGKNPDYYYCSAMWEIIDS